MPNVMVMGYYVVTDRQSKGKWLARPWRGERAGGAKNIRSSRYLKAEGTRQL